MFDDAPEKFCQEQLELITKAGRRCAYDLLHAASCIRNEREAKIFHERAYMWLNVFNPGDDGKNYRHRLHREIEILEDHVAELQQLCAKHGIDHTKTGPDIPF